MARCWPDSAPPPGPHFTYRLLCVTGGDQPQEVASASAADIGVGESSTSLDGERSEELLNVRDVVELLRDFLRAKALTESEISREVCAEGEGGGGVYWARHGGMGGRAGRACISEEEPRKGMRHA